jgi:BON domain
MQLLPFGDRRARRIDMRAGREPNGGLGGSWKLLASAVVGATAGYFFDPDRGRMRRIKAKDRAATLMGGAIRRVGKRRGHVTSQALGVAKEVHVVNEGAPPPNDQTVAEKIQSEILGKADYPKGKINVNVEGGVAVLRGELENEDLINALEQDVRKVTGVIDVENLVHLPGQLPPNKEAALRASPGS